MPGVSAPLAKPSVTSGSSRKVTRSAAENWRPRAGVETARTRAAMLRETLEFFEAADILLVDTPALSQSALSDPNIDSLATTLGASRATYYLHTSPEFCMKRLLAAGFPDIGQICRVFRDGESGRLHQPEFTMIEWYRLGFGLEDIMTDTEALIGCLLGKSDTKVTRRSYRAAFRECLGIDPIEAGISELRQQASNDERLRAALGDDRNAWLDYLLATQVAPTFEDDRLTTIYHYPASQAALARRSPSDAGVADRFEVFVGSVEVANGYVELTDYAEQAERFAADQEIRRSRGLDVRPLDAELIACLRAGLPDCAGVAVGLDRLLMLRSNAQDMRDVLHFPLMDSV